MSITEPVFAKVTTLRGLCSSAFTLVTPKPFKLRHKVRSALPRPPVVADFLPSQTAAVFEMQRQVKMHTLHILTQVLNWRIGIYCSGLYSKLFHECHSKAVHPTTRPCTCRPLPIWLKSAWLR